MLRSRFRGRRDEARKVLFTRLEHLPEKYRKEVFANFDRNWEVDVKE